MTNLECQLFGENSKIDLIMHREAIRELYKNYSAPLAKNTHRYPPFNTAIAVVAARTHSYRSKLRRSKSGPW